MCHTTHACICASSTGKANAGREGGQRGHGPTHMTHSRLWHLYVLHTSFVCVTWLMHIYSHHQQAKQFLVGEAGSEVTVLLTWLIRVYDICACSMTYLNMPHDSCIYMYIINRQSNCWWGRRGARSRSNLSGTKCSIMSRFSVIIFKLHSEWGSWASTYIYLKPVEQTLSSGIVRIAKERGHTPTWAALSAISFPTDYILQKRRILLRNLLPLRGNLVPYRVTLLRDNLLLHGML